MSDGQGGIFKHELFCILALSDNFGCFRFALVIEEMCSSVAVFSPVSMNWFVMERFIQFVVTEILVALRRLIKLLKRSHFTLSHYCPNGLIVLFSRSVDTFLQNKITSFSFYFVNHVICFWEMDFAFLWCIRKPVVFFSKLRLTCFTPPRSSDCLLGRSQIVFVFLIQ